MSQPKPTDPVTKLMNAIGRLMNWGYWRRRRGICRRCGGDGYLRNCERVIVSPREPCGYCGGVGVETVYDWVGPKR